jgi:hypothetical protein
MPADWGKLRHLRSVQDGVVTRAQLHACGLTYADLQRLVRRRELTRVRPGVFLDHTGPQTWMQRAWIAVLACQPAALSHASVWRETSPIHVAVHHSRRVTGPPGVVVHRMRHLDARVSWLRSPPRVLVEEAVLDVAGLARDDFQAIAALGEVVQARLTTYDAVARALRARERTLRGRWMGSVLTDLATGANSVLEHEYLIRVERAHGLPAADRQVVSAAGARRVERDVLYGRYGLAVELVGRAFHDNPRAWDRDLDRDLAAAVEERLRTVRLGWAQVVRDACATAERLGVLLRRGGWAGVPTPCPSCG